MLDDFGTGYSSLSQLAMFPFDKIKIDKSFTQNLTKRSECAAIISATLTLAENLNIATTAEGVETVDQYRILRLAGVTSLQGYLFKRPGPAAELDFDQVYDGGGKIEARGLAGFHFAQPAARTGPAARLSNTITLEMKAFTSRT